MVEEFFLDSQADFDELCSHIRSQGIVAFDTEFVSEHTHRPELCLLQFATPERHVVVDPFAVPRLDAWWELMTDEQTTIVVHGGREEVRFCLTNTGQPPRLLKDIQVAEGMRGRSFPLGYEAIVKRVLGKKAHGKETRTDWKRRPLSRSQIEYAVEDVRYVLEIWDRQKKGCQKLKRLEWVEAEFQRMIDEVASERGPDSWQRLSGVHRLSPRELAVARDLYFWREREGLAKNRPVRKVLRDDLVIELARRQPKTFDDLMATRDMVRNDYRKLADDMLAVIETAVALPESQLPPRLPQPDDDQAQDEQVLGQLLGLALANRCAAINIAMPLVGKVADLRHLVRWHVYHEQNGELPRLMQGWRAEVCGELLKDVLDGKIALRVGDPHSDHPLVFDHLDAKPTE